MAETWAMEDLENLEASGVEIDWKQMYEDAESVLVSMVGVVASWHGEEAWDIYFDHSPEMACVRDHWEREIPRKAP